MIITEGEGQDGVRVVVEVHHELGAVDEAVDPGGGESGDAGRVLQEDV